MLRESLDNLNWFSPSANHRAVTITVEPLDDKDGKTPLLPNIVAITDEEMTSLDAELGSNLSDQEWFYAIDVYAESQTVGRHLAGDIRAILEGRMQSIGRDSPVLDVYDLTQATPSVIFSCEISSVESGRVRNFSKPYQKNWFVITFVLSDFVSMDTDQEEIW